MTTQTGESPSRSDAALATVAEVSRILLEAVLNGQDFTSTVDAGVTEGEPKRGADGQLHAVHSHNGGYDIHITVQPLSSPGASSLRP